MSYEPGTLTEVIVKQGKRIQKLEKKIAKLKGKTKKLKKTKK